mmetsp:Transcript_36699/g.76653  ORF Transcript_36699/g.76653 Transcript_36699/m.76653 type:complete len:221 (-) Transcript_36699:686-1348(-)
MCTAAPVHTAYATGKGARTRRTRKGSAAAACHWRVASTSDEQMSPCANQTRSLAPKHTSACHSSQTASARLHSSARRQLARAPGPQLRMASMTRSMLADTPPAGGYMTEQLTSKSGVDSRTPPGPTPPPKPRTVADTPLRPTDAPVSARSPTPTPMPATCASAHATCARRRWRRQGPRARRPRQKDRGGRDRLRYGGLRCGRDTDSAPARASVCRQGAGG